MMVKMDIADHTLLKIISESETMKIFNLLFCLLLICGICGAHPLAAPGVTSLTNQEVKYTVSSKGSVTLKAGEVTAVIVDNSPAQTELTPEHKGRYNGVAYLGHRNRRENLFVPTYAGLNYEHIHDGTLKVHDEKFEPREYPLELRVINDSTVELYQAPTPNWKLESCGRYQLLEDGTIEYTFECIPREKLFQQNYIGLFWASYINAPEEMSLNFYGRKKGTTEAKWLHYLSPKHGVRSTHPPAGYAHSIPFEDGFELTLANNPSEYEYLKPFYYGVSHEMAFVNLFREKDQIWFAQSPSGGGKGNPAWDFQWFIPDYQVDEAYGFVMRAAYLPYTNREELIEKITPHLEALNPAK